MIISNTKKKKPKKIDNIQKIIEGGEAQFKSMYNNLQNQLKDELVSKLISRLFIQLDKQKKQIEEYKQEIFSLKNNLVYILKRILLAKKEDGVDDDTHLVQESEGDYLQFELLEDENALLFKLGFTVEEAQAIIDDPYKALAEYEAEQNAEEE